MPPPSTCCLKLELNRRFGAEFEVQVIEDPKWEMPPEPSQVPYSPDDLTVILKALRKSRYNPAEFTPAQRKALKRLNLLEHGQFIDKLAQHVGQTLYQALIPAHCPIDKAVDDLLAETNEQKGIPILQLRFYENGVELARYPWELLHHKGFLLRRKGELTRYVSHPALLEPLAVEPPLRLLYIESQANKLSQGQEQASVRQALKELETKGMLVVETLAKPTFKHLQQRLETQSNPPIYILHFDGHGAFAKKCPACGAMNYPHWSNCQNEGKGCRQIITGINPQGYLVFEDANGAADWVDSEKLGDLLCRQAIRLAIISTCGSSSLQGETIFSGVAPALIQIGIPAVVAMQLPITVEAATEFMIGFYTALANFNPLVTAMNAGRRRLLDNEAEWFIPTLYLRSKDHAGHLFRQKQD